MLVNSNAVDTLRPKTRRGGPTDRFDTFDDSTPERLVEVPTYPEALAECKEPEEPLEERVHPVGAWVGPVEGWVGPVEGWVGVEERTVD